MKLHELNNPIYRLNNLYKIKDKNKNFIRFQFNNLQEKIINSMARRNVILKPRQIGVSTLFLLKYLDDAIWNSNTTTGILAHKRESTETLFEIIKLAYETMHPIFKPQANYDTKYSLSFNNKSKIFVSLEIRSTTLNNLHISEAAFIEDESRIKASMEALTLNGNISIESTPNGLQGDFYERYKAAYFNQNDYKTHFFPWFEFPEYRISTTEQIKPIEEERLLGLDTEQINFRRTKIKDLGFLFFQEYPEDAMSCFLTSSYSWFSLGKLQEIIKTIDKSKQDKVFYQSKKFEKGHTYVAGADVAEGLGGDYSVLVILDASSRELVARLRIQDRADSFAQRINEICKEYRYPLLAVERNGLGLATIYELERLGYPNLYKESEDKSGWTTTRLNKKLICSLLKAAIEDADYIFSDEMFLQECLTFVDTNGKLSAVGSNHDDIIMASAIALNLAVNNLNILNTLDIKKLIRVEGMLETARDF